MSDSDQHPTRLLPPCVQDGKREGVGVKKYADGATFEGFWRDGKKHGIGVFRPARRESDKRASRSSVILPPMTGKELSTRPCATESVQAVEFSELSTCEWLEPR